MNNLLKFRYSARLRYIEISHPWGGAYYGHRISWAYGRLRYHGSHLPFH